MKHYGSMIAYGKEEDILYNGTLWYNDTTCEKEDVLYNGTARIEESL